MSYYFMLFFIPYVIHLLISAFILFIFLSNLLIFDQLVLLIAVQGGVSIMLTLMMGVFYKNHLIRMIYLSSLIDGSKLSLKPATKAFLQPFLVQHEHEKRMLLRVIKRFERRLHVRG